LNIPDLLASGLEALVDYVGYHVLTCLVPAFLLAGAIVVFLPRDVIIRYLGSETRKVSHSHWPQQPGCSWPHAPAL